MGNQYESIQGNMETLIIVQKELFSIGNDIETKLLQVVKESDLAKVEKEVAHQSITYLLT